MSVSLDSLIDQQLIKWPVHSVAERVLSLAIEDDAEFLFAYERELSLLNLSQPLLFDEFYYVSTYRDVLSALRGGQIRSGLHHYLGWGIFEGRVPSAEIGLRLTDIKCPLPNDFDEKRYIDSNSDVELFLREFPQLSGRIYALNYGSRLGHFPPENSKNIGALESNREVSGLFELESSLDQLASSRRTNVGGRLSMGDRLIVMRTRFDSEFYRRMYLLNESWDGDEFVHYITVGARRGYSPSENFDEGFYTKFYPDISKAISSGSLLCGFEHFVVAGEAEQRIPKFDIARCLEAAYPGVTVPVSLQNIAAIESKFTPCSYEVNFEFEATIWFVMPFLNADLMFGGFSSILAFIEILLEKGLRVGFFLREAPASQVDFFVFRHGSKGRLSAALKQMRIVSGLEAEMFVFSPKDIFISYSNWDGLWARRFSAETEWRRPIYWIQEYEPIFHHHDSFHFLSNSAYFYPHIGVFNSQFLRGYFEEKRIGVYANPESSASISYEHLLWRSNARRLNQKAKRRRTFFVYARPEGHAARNLFEISVLSIKMALQNGAFKGAWRFVGLGALTGPHKVSLGLGAELHVLERLPPQEYASFLASVDVGMSLMYAPHPSLLPFELARAGAIVVTNEFESRQSGYISERSDRIVTFKPYVEDCVRAITDAVQLSLLDKRVPERGNYTKYPDTKTHSWGNVFDDEFFEKLASTIDHEFSWSAFRI